MCGALWMVLDDTTALPELVDGAVAAAIGASAATLALARAPVRFAARAAWARRWWRPPARLIADLPSLARILLRAVAGGDRHPGRLRTLHFGVEADPEARAAQVALASVAGSVAPNTIVVAIDEADQTLIVHELVPTSSRTGADPLELG